MAGIVDGWRPELHPRDKHGRFRNKWKLATAAAALIDGIIARFNPKTFTSDMEARDYLRAEGGHDYGKHLDPAVTDYLNGGWQQVNSDMRAGKGELPPGMASAFRPSKDDLILSRATSAQAFGLNEAQIDDGVHEWTGRLVADKAPGNASIGTPLQSGPGTITWAILAPKGTNLIVPGNGSPDVVYEPGQPLRITKVTGDAQSGIHVWAVMTPAHNNKGQLVKTRALGRKLTTAEKGTPDQTDVNLPEAQRVQAQTPPSMEDRVKALEEKLTTAGTKAEVPAAPAPVKRAKRVPKPPHPTDQPPPDEAPSVLPEKTAAGSATVIGLRATALKRNVTPEDAVRLRDKLDGQTVQTLRDAAASLEIKKLGAKKEAIVDKIVDHVYGKRTTIPPRTPAEPKKAIKAAEKGTHPPEVTALRESAADIAKRAGRPQGPVRPIEALTAPPVKHAAEPAEVVAMRKAMDRATQASPAKLRSAAEKAGIAVPEDKKTSPEIVAHVVNAVTTGKISAPSVPAKKAEPNVAEVSPQLPKGATAADKAVTAQLRNGDKILVTKNEAGQWSVARQKTGATTLTVTRTELSGGRRGRITVHGKDDAGNDISVKDVAAHQTFFKKTEKAVPTKAAPSVTATPQTTPATPGIPDGASFKEAFKGAGKEIGQPEPGPRRAQFNRAYFLAARGKFAEAHAGLREDISNNQATLDDLKANQPDSKEIPGLEHDLRTQIRLANFIDNHSKGTKKLAPSKPEAPATPHTEDKNAPNALKAYSTNSRVRKSIEADPSPQNMLAGAIEHDEAGNYFRMQARVAKERGEARRKFLESKGRTDPAEVKKNETETAAAVKGFNTQEEAHRQEAASLRDRAQQAAVAHSEAVRARHAAAVAADQAAHEKAAATEKQAAAAAKTRYLLEEVNSRGGTVRVLGGALTHEEALRKHKELGDKLTAEANVKRRPHMPELKRHGDVKITEVSPDQTERYKLAGENAARKHGEEMGQPADLVKKAAARKTAVGVSSKDVQEGDPIVWQPPGETPILGHVIRKGRFTYVKWSTGREEPLRSDRRDPSLRKATESDIAALGKPAKKIEDYPAEDLYKDLLARNRKGVKASPDLAHFTDEQLRTEVQRRTGLTAPSLQKAVAPPDVVPKGHVLRPTDELPPEMRNAIKVMAQQKPEDVRKAAEKFGIPVPENLKTSDEIARHVVSEMARRHLAAQATAGEKKTSPAQLGLNKAIDSAKRAIPDGAQGRQTIDSLDKVDRADPAVLRAQAKRLGDLAETNRRLISMVRSNKSTSGQQKVADDRERAVHHLDAISAELTKAADDLEGKKASTTPAKAAKEPLVASERAAEDAKAKVAHKVAEDLKQATSKDQARGLLAGRSRAELVDIAKAGGTVHRSGATKQEITDLIINNQVGRRLTSDAIRGAGPAPNLSVPNVKPSQHPVTAKRTSMVGELVHQLTEAKSEEDRRRMLEAKTGPTLRAIGQDRGFNFGAGEGKKDMVTKLMDHFAGRTGKEVVAGKMSDKPILENHWGVPGGPVNFHEDGVIGQAIDSMGEDKRLDVGGEPLANVLGKIATAGVRGDRTSQEVVGELKSLRDRIPAGTKARRALDSAVERLDTPARAPLHLPDGTPAPLVKLMEDLSKIPLARASAPGRESEMDKLATLVQEWHDGKLSPMRFTRQLEQDLLNNRHESTEGKFEIDRKVQRALDALEQLYKENRDNLRPPGVGGAGPKAPSSKERSYLDPFNRLDVKKYAQDQHGVDLNQFLDLSRNPMPLTNAPVADQRPFSYALQKIIDEAASGQASHKATLQALTERLDRTRGHIRVVRDRKAHLERMGTPHHLGNSDKAVLEQGPKLMSALEKVVGGLEQEKLPARKTRPTLPPTVAGQMAPVDEEKFHEHGLHDVISHGGQALPASFVHDASKQGRIARATNRETVPQRPGLTQEENKALDLWTAVPVAGALNGSLRLGHPVHGEKEFPERADIGKVDLDQLQSHLDQAIQKSELKHDAVLWRGVVVKNADLKRFEPGAVFSDPGYLATAASRNVADRVIARRGEMAENKGTKPALFKILAPKGTRAAVGHQSVDELVLPRGQRFQVVRVEEPTKPGGARTYVVQALMPDHAQGKDLTESIDYTKLAAPSQGLGKLKTDEQLGHILVQQHFDTKPKVLSGEEMDRAVKEDGGVELFRSVNEHENRTADQLAEEFRSGDLHPGTGVYGNGTYATPESPVSSTYGKSQLRMVLPPSARTISYPDIVKLRDRQQEKYGSQARQIKQELDRATGDPGRLRQLQRELDQLIARQRVSHDPGRLAALLGYDAIVVPQGYRKGPKSGGAAEYVILNRSALLVEKARKE